MSTTFGLDMLFLLVRFWCWLTFPRYLDHPDPCYWSSPGSLKLSPRTRPAILHPTTSARSEASACHPAMNFGPNTRQLNIDLMRKYQLLVFPQGKLHGTSWVPCSGATQTPRPLFLRRTSQSPLRTLERLPSAPVLASWVGAGLENVRPMYTIYL